jgi:LDH2 family malate/lactate/ureidoglycolate dehydrogenase
MGILTLPASTLQRSVATVLGAAGAPDDIAEVVARSLVLSNLKGVDSHGFVRVADYLQYVRDGRIDPGSRPVVTRRGPIVWVEGRRAFGQLAARDAALVAVEEARTHGVALAILSGSKHVGRVGEFVELCAERGCIGIAFANGGPPGGSVAPYGGLGPALGTNPIAFAFPLADRPPVVSDFSTSIVAEGKVRLHRQAGRPVPEGWLVDAAGRPSTDPEDLYRGGALLPAGGHKGYALGLLVEVLGGVLAGEGCASAGDDPGNGFVLVVVDGGDAFPAGAGRAVRALEAHVPAPGYERVVVPGGPERDAERRRAREGIPFPARTWQEFAAAAQSVGVAVPEPVEGTAGV